MPVNPPASEPVRRAPNLRARVRYRLDLALSRGSLAVIGYLAAITVLITIGAATLLTLLHLSGINGGPRLSFPEALWQSMLRMLGRGSFASDQHWVTRLLSLLVTLVGIFLAGALIALIAATVNQRISGLRKGRSPVIESDHTVVLGWSPRLPTILAELAVANRNRRRAAVVVLAERPKDEMEDELRRRVPRAGSTRVVCRTGDPSRPADLELVNAAAARSIIVLADAEGDASVVKAVLAVRSLDPEFARTRLVAELTSAHHAEALRMLTEERIATVQADEVISQVTAQACHQRGLAVVFRDLLGFDGDAIYLKPVPELTGHTYQEAQLAFERSALLGVCRSGTITLNPAPSHRLATDDEIVAISADDDTVVADRPAAMAEVEVPTDVMFVEPAQRIAIIGWSGIGPAVLAELDQVLGDGSSVDVLIEAAHVASGDLELPRLANCLATVHALAHGPQPLLAALGDSEYDQVIVLGYRNHLSPSRADAHTLLTLMTLHKAWRSTSRRPRIVAEMLDRSNVEIAKTIDVDDFIVSDELSSLMLAQVSERLEVQAVFRELFTSEGAFVSLRPAYLYAPSTAVSFAQVVAAASLRGESALGYRIAGQAVMLNPPKSATVQFAATDAVLVLGGRSVRPDGERAEPAARTVELLSDPVS